MVNSDGNWNPARLIPTSGIKGAREQETRATSALLSVMESVPEFGRALLRRVGAPAGKIKCWVEVPFKLPNGDVVRPDGAISVTGRGRQWTALVEVKTDRSKLSREQLETYLDVCKTENYDALISISNQFSHTGSAPGRGRSSQSSIGGISSSFVECSPDRCGIATRASRRV